IWTRSSAVLSCPRWYAPIQIMGHPVVERRSIKPEKGKAVVSDEGGRSDAAPDGDSDDCWSVDEGTLDGRDTTLDDQDALSVSVRELWTEVHDDESSSDASDQEDDDGSSESEVPDHCVPRNGEVRLTPSLFPGRAATVFFEYPAALNITRSDKYGLRESLGHRRLLFRTSWERKCVTDAFVRAGFSQTRALSSWSASWTKHPTTEQFQALKRFQKVNHLPGSWCIGRKDRLAVTIARARRSQPSLAATAAAAAAAAAAASSGGNGLGSSFSLGGGGGSSGFLGTAAAAAAPLTVPPLNDSSPWDFLPESFLLPDQRKLWARAVETDPRALWISKPPASSCGRGVRVLPRGAGVGAATSNSALPGRGRKEGLVRISAKPYTLRNLRSRFTHLTNFSVNRRAANFRVDGENTVEAAEAGAAAAGWALSSFWGHLKQA
ncbi:unnamed protein product, partial [Phaeothamnion confervicola]